MFLLVDQNQFLSMDNIIFLLWNNKRSQIKIKKIKLINKMINSNKVINLKNPIRKLIKKRMGLKKIIRKKRKKNRK